MTTRALLSRRFATIALSGVFALAATFHAQAEKKYGPGASDTEVKIGNFVPYSGPASSFSLVGKVHDAYARMLNDNGGINGRKINFVSYDDHYSPPKAVEQARKLIEKDEVLFLWQTLGTASNTAILKYVNAKKVPHLMLSSGGTKFGDDPKTYPWTIPFNPAFATEGRIYANLIKDKYPDARIAVLVQNDEYGKDIYKGFKEGLGDKVSMIIAEAPYDLSDATVDSQMVKLKASGADLFVNFATPKFAAQAIRKMGELNWKPVHILNNVASTKKTVLVPAGLENAQDAITANYIMDASDPKWQDEAGMKKFKAFMEKYLPDLDRDSTLPIYAYAAAQTMEHVLREAGDNLTRENVMSVASNLKDFRPDILLPGVTMNTSPTDHLPIEEMQVMVFKGEGWQPEGPLLSAGGEQPAKAE